MKNDQYFDEQNAEKSLKNNIQTQFSKEIQGLRDAMLKQLEKFDTTTKIKKLKLLVDKSKDPIHTFAALAARIFIIRGRLYELAAARGVKTKAPILNSATDTENTKKDKAEDTSDTASTWVSVITVQEGEINGVNLMPGITVKINKSDFDRLEARGLVELAPLEKEKTETKAETEPESADKPKTEGKAKSKSKKASKASITEKKKGEKLKDVDTNPDTGNDKNETTDSVDGNSEKNTEVKSETSKDSEIEE